jgi:hypothetical protein
MSFHFHRQTYHHRQTYNPHHSALDSWRVCPKAMSGMNLSVHCQSYNRRQTYHCHRCVFHYQSRCVRIVESCQVSKC